MNCLCYGSHMLCTCSKSNFKANSKYPLRRSYFYASYVVYFYLHILNQCFPNVASTEIGPSKYVPALSQTKLRVSTPQTPACPAEIIFNLPDICLQLWPAFTSKQKQNLIPHAFLFLWPSQYKQSSYPTTFTTNVFTKKHFSNRACNTIV